MKFRKTTDKPTSFISVVILFDEAFNYGDGDKFWGYGGTNAEPLCVEFCNTVWCLSSVNYLTCC
jgi:hypothetical protein